MEQFANIFLGFHKIIFTHTAIFTVTALKSSDSHHMSSAAKSAMRKNGQSTVIIVNSLF